MATDLSWRSQAKCRGMDPQLFYPQPNSKGIVPKRAQNACKNCPVVNQCYDWALRNEVFGYWAGLDERQREGRRRAAGIVPKKWNYDMYHSVPHGTEAGYRWHIRRDNETCGPCLEAHALNIQFTRPSRARPTCQGETDVTAESLTQEVEEAGPIRFRLG